MLVIFSLGSQDSYLSLKKTRFCKSNYQFKKNVSLKSLWGVEYTEHIRNIGLSSFSWVGGSLVTAEMAATATSMHQCLFYKHQKPSQQIVIPGS